MKKLTIAILLVCLVCLGCFSIANAYPISDEVIEVDTYIYDDGTVEFEYTIEGAAWVEMWILEEKLPEGTDIVQKGVAESEYPKLSKGEKDDQTLGSGRVVGPSYDIADSVFNFEDGKTYYVYFAKCDGSDWCGYSVPYELTYTAPEVTVTEAPTQGPTEAVTQVPTQSATKAPADNAGFPTWAWIAIAVVAVAIIAVVIVVVSKKKK